MVNTGESPTAALPGAFLIASIPSCGSRNANLTEAGSGSACGVQGYRGQKSKSRISESGKEADQHRGRDPGIRSALGPKTRRMTAELDAHWINVNFTEEFSAITARDMETQYRAAGKDPASKRKTIFSFGAVLNEGEAYDSPRVKAEVGPVAMMMLHNAMEEESYGSLVGEFASSSGANPAIDHILREYRTVYESDAPADARYLMLHKGHLMFVRPDENRFATADLIRAMPVSGTAPELRDRMRRLKEAGYDEVVVQITLRLRNHDRRLGAGIRDRLSCRKPAPTLRLRRSELFWLMKRQIGQGSAQVRGARAR